MVIRPRTKRKIALRTKRCPKCNCLVKRRVRCKRCHYLLKRD